MLAVLLVVAYTYTCACATGPEPRRVPADDLFCARDADCEIVATDVVGEGCCHTHTEPYAISRAAAERHQVRMDTMCGRAVCTMECRYIEVTELEDWAAVCSGHVCKRRSTKPFPSAKPSCM